MTGIDEYRRDAGNFDPLMPVAEKGADLLRGGFRKQELPFLLPYGFHRFPDRVIQQHPVLIGPEDQIIVSLDQQADFPVRLPLQPGPGFLQQERQRNRIAENGHGRTEQQDQERDGATNDRHAFILLSASIPRFFQSARVSRSQSPP